MTMPIEREALELPEKCKMRAPSKYASDLDCERCGCGEGEVCPDYNAASAAHIAEKQRKAALSTPPQAPGVLEATVTRGPHPEAWFPWSGAQGRPNLYSDDPIRTCTAHGVHSNQTTVGAVHWGHKNPSEWEIVRIGVMLENADTLRRMEALTGYRVPTLVSSPPVSGEVGELVETVAWRTDIFEQLPNGKLSRLILDADEVKEPGQDWTALVPASALTAANADRDRLEGIIAARDKQLTKEIALSSKYVGLHQAAEADRDRLARELEEARVALREAVVVIDAEAEVESWNRINDTLRSISRAALASGEAP